MFTKSKAPEEHDTVLKAFLIHVEKTPNLVLFTQPMGGGEVKEWTYKEALGEAQKMAAYIESKMTGLQEEKGSRIAICSKNCAWWVLADLAVWISGNVSVPIYPTLNRETVAYILQHSESRMLFVGKLDEKPWEEMKEGIPEDLPKVTFPICPDDCAGDKWDDIISKTKPIPEMVERLPEEMATIMYTSGSTGMPKGVMLSFFNMAVTCQAALEVIPLLKERDRYLSYLPLAHTADRLCGECLALYRGTHVFYAESMSTFVPDLVRARPTVFVSVPRLWTKFQQGVHAKMPPKKLDMLLSIPILGWLVRWKILKGLGLDNVRVAISGSAPIPDELLNWYRRLGLSMLEAYGMTENFALSHATKPGRIRSGYVGEPYTGVEHRIAPDGEVQVKSLGTMMGYYKNEEATKATMTEDGWLRTGDRGEIDEMNRLKITGRLKEIFKTSKGKYVAPAPIENKINASNLIDLSCVAGNGPQPIVIVQLAEQTRQATAESEAKRTELAAEIEKLINQVNATVDPHEALLHCIVVKDQWEPENGLLTPTLKIMRTKIEDSYKANYDEWYGSNKKVIWYNW